jgi:uridine kinase
MERPSALFVGIAGGTGSGKTTLAQRIVASLPGHVAALEHDWYYRDRASVPPKQRQALNYDEPRALENDLLIQHLNQLRAAQTVTCPQYDFTNHVRLPAVRVVEPAPIVVVEGILLFAVPELRDAFDLRVFVDTDDDIRLLRRIERDIVERQRDIASIRAQYYATVRPMHLLHVAPSKSFAHLIVPEGGENAQALDVIVGRLKYLLLT